MLRLQFPDSLFKNTSSLTDRPTNIADFDLTFATWLRFTPKLFKDFQFERSLKVPLGLFVKDTCELSMSKKRLRIDRVELKHGESL